MSLADAELACGAIAEGVRRAAGARWLQGARRPPLACRVASPAVELFATHRLHKVEEAVARGLVAWAEGDRRVVVLDRVPLPREVLAWQARGERCVSLLDDATPTGPHADALAFALHDLCHLEKLFEPEHHRAQVGFFATLDRALGSRGWPALEEGFDDAWRKELEHVAADMNGSAIFLFAALKMKLKMAVRRRLAALHGRPAPAGGPLAPDEERAYEERLEGLLGLFDLDERGKEAGRRISTKRDAREAARALLAVFDARA
jgi:hypothetical protein